MENLLQMKALFFIHSTESGTNQHLHIQARSELVGGFQKIIKG